MKPVEIAWHLKRALEDLESARLNLLSDLENVERVRSRILDAEEEIKEALKKI